MNVAYDLIDAAGGNLVGSFSTPREASELARDAFARWGEEGVADLVLFAVVGDTATLVAAGVDIARLTGGPTVVHATVGGASRTGSSLRIVDVVQHGPVADYSHSQANARDLAHA